MKWRQMLLNAWTALLQHKLRSSLSALGIIFAVVAVVTMLAIAEGAKHETLEQIEQLGTNNIIVRQPVLTEAQTVTSVRRHSRGLSLADVDALAAGIAPLKCAAPLKEVRASVLAAAEEDVVEILAVTPAYARAKNLEVRAGGRFLCDADMTQKSMVCVLGGEASRMLAARGRVGETVRLEDREFRVVGVLRHRLWTQGKTPALTSRDLNRSIIIPLGTEPMVFGRRIEFGEITEISLQVGSSKDVEATAEAARRILTQAHGGAEDFQIVVPQALLAQEQRTQRVFNLVLGCIAAISLVVGGIGIMNIMLASVSERTREIGVRRAIGATRGHIVVHFLLESILLTAAGGVIGVAAGAGSAFIISSIAGWRTVLTPWSVVAALAMAGGVGVVSGLYPAVRAAWMDPVGALRHE